ncbi:MAG: hypothetical protein MUC49_16785 [Raineya sp.]|jgi:hypothetical protein|nr:hypothetical protein [Raineya sp.]
MYFRFIILSFWIFFLQNGFAQIHFTTIPADTVYHYQIENNDTNKRVPTTRNLHIYDKLGHIREILTEKMQNKTWKYTSRIIFGYNAINRLQSYKKEVWDSVGRDWLKYSRRTFAYNIRYLPINYIDEIWDNQNNVYQKVSRTNFEYTLDNRVFEANYKTYKNNVWMDSLRQNIAYDSLKNMIGFEQKKALKEGWKIEYVLEYKFQKDKLIETIIKGQKAMRSFEILGKITYLYNDKGYYLGEKKFKYDLYKQKYNEQEGIKLSYHGKKKYWIYTPYTIEQGKIIIKNQKIIYPTSEKTQNPLQDFHFQLINIQ